MLARAVTHALVGLEPRKVEVEAHLQPGIPGFAIVGLADRACQEAKHRVRSGVVSAALEWPVNRRITVNLAPAALRKEGSGFDLPISLAVLGATRQLPPERLAEHAAVGELALDGRIRPVAGTLAVAEGARRAGLTHVVCAAESAPEAALAGIEPVPVRHLGEVVAYFRGEIDAPAFQPLADGRRGTGRSRSRGPARAGARAPRARDRRGRLAQPAPHGAAGDGQDDARPPPPRHPAAAGHAEALEVTRIHSVAGVLPAGDARCSRCRRSGRRTTAPSAPAIVGGGPTPRPGEVSLAHRGVLLLDELPEFPRSVLESLRQPLEDGVVAVARVGGHALFPARFQLVGTMNMCPCGARGDPARRVQLHRRSGSPRIGRSCRARSSTASTSPSRCLGPERPSSRLRPPRPRTLSASASSRARERLARASPRRTEAASELLSSAVDRLPLSGRGRARVARVARTIAALARLGCRGAGARRRGALVSHAGRSAGAHERRRTDSAPRSCVPAAARGDPRPAAAALPAGFGGRGDPLRAGGRRRRCAGVLVLRALAWRGRSPASSPLPGLVVVSGMARGIDGEAHRGALDAGGRTVAVLGCGIDRDYPAAHARARASHRRERPRRLGVRARRRARAVAVPGSEPDHRGPLCRATLVVEARERSGALITADFALEEGRDVLAVPGEITSSLSAGTNALLKLGATPVTAAVGRARAVELEPGQAERRRARYRGGGAPRAASRLALTADELVRATASTRRERCRA